MLNNFLSALEQQWRGALVFVLLLLVLMYLVRELFWLMGWGRFKTAQRDSGSPASDARGASSSSISEDSSRIWTFFVTTFIAKTISEFRHLLALLIFLLFSGSLVMAVLPGLIALDAEMMTEGLQGVAAALGGLFGSIIGYYFGEQVGSATARAADRGESRGEAIQDDAAQQEIQPARIRVVPEGQDKPEQNP